MVMALRKVDAFLQHAHPSSSSMSVSLISRNPVTKFPFAHEDRESLATYIRAPEILAICPDAEKTFASHNGSPEAIVKRGSASQTYGSSRVPILDEEIHSACPRANEFSSLGPGKRPIWKNLRRG
ncbi:hypothetical protein ACJ73_05303 [Blastomyces percursus]|uniref:Uncharacterized protein n=1 Tax=Blastomyces percursus TaxID=1658174 RepID=A0A1J9QSZ6_9EURO|nr:hypothetical protein ACJ73_05303 [Blastomyces percursus]